LAISLIEDSNELNIKCFDIPYPKIPIKNKNMIGYSYIVDYNFLKKMRKARSDEDRNGITKEEFDQMLEKLYYEVSKKSGLQKM
jgi:hypothetical protein